MLSLPDLSVMHQTKQTLSILTFFFIICTIETSVHYSKHLLYTEKMVGPEAQNGSRKFAAQHFFHFIHILLFFL